MTPSGRTGAAVDIGSNSVHLLVARAAPRGHDPALEHVYEESELLGLGDAVDAFGELPPGHVGQLIAAVQRQRDRASDHGAEWLDVVATAPLRRAVNGPQVAAALERATGATVRVLSEHEEGELTFCGVLAGAVPPEALLVVDIGGGSSEVIFHQPGCALEVISLPGGSASLTAELVKRDPPTDEDIGRLRSRATELAAGLPPFETRRAIFSGGTVTKLARFGPLERASLDLVLALARSQPAGAIANRHGLKLRRAQQLAAGASLVTALLDRYALTSADVSEGSLRDGLILSCRD